MADSTASEAKVEVPGLWTFLRVVAAEIPAAAIVALQGLTAGLFGAGHGSGSFFLHVALGLLPIVVAFMIAFVFPIPELFVFGVAGAVFGNSIALLLFKLAGGLPSSEADLVKFVITAYGSYLIVFYAWALHEMRKAKKWGLEGWIFVYRRLVRLSWDLGWKLGFRLAGGDPRGDPNDQGS